MSQLSRRDFLAAAATTAVVFSLPVLQARAADAPTSQPSAGTIDVGPLGSFDKDGINDHWAKSKQIFVIREDSKVYAVTTICTHKGRQMVAQNGEIFCPAHKSHFSVQGTVTGGPAKRSLTRYAVSLDSDNHVIVDKSKSFSETQWDDPASFVAAKSA